MISDVEAMRVTSVHLRSKPAHLDSLDKTEDMGSISQLTSRRLSPARHMIRSLPLRLMALAEHSAAWMDVKSKRKTSSLS